MIRNQMVALALLAATLASQTNADEPSIENEIKILKFDVLKKEDWKNVGFKTPQATAQTFLWATREGNVDVLLKCFAPDTLPKFTDEDKDRMKAAANAATAFQPLATRAKNDKQLALKFRVEGWQEKPFEHQFQLVDGEWRLDGKSSTRTADW
jgi:hypothetical protein